MDAIKKKMKNLAQSTEEAKARVIFFEGEIKRINKEADSYEDEVNNHKSLFVIILDLKNDSSCEQFTRR